MVLFSENNVCTWPSRIRFSIVILYLRNLLTHTANNLLQTLNNVKNIQFFVVKHKLNIIHIMCENFKTIP